MTTQHKADEEETYAVGYGKPPKEHQFKPGHSKSKGRKRGSRNVRKLFEEAVFEPTPYLSKGQTKTAPALGVMFQRLKYEGLKGDPKAMMAILNMAMRLLPLDQEEAEVAELSVAEMQLLETLQAKAASLKGQ